MRNASDEEIDNFLEDVRSAIDSKKFIPVNRDKNRWTLAKLGLTWKDAKAEIYDLKRANYSSGPETDRDHPETDKMWKFGKLVCGYHIYIKLKVLYQEDNGVKIISFHIDEPFE